jgi:hypothetical protein
MKLYAAVAAVLLLDASLVADSVSAQSAVTPAPPLQASFPDIDRNVFEPGDQVDVRWALTGRDVRYLESHPWSECELYYSVDGGRNWLRITPQLAVSRRNFIWTVPDTPTDSARLALQVGIEGDGDFVQFPSKPFTIRPATDAPYVRLLSPAEQVVRPGSTLELRWASTVQDVVRYEVSISSDRGAHYFTVGQTTRTSFSYRIPADYDGSLTVRIVAHRANGQSVASPIDAASAVRVRG